MIRLSVFFTFEVIQGSRRFCGSLWKKSLSMPPDESSGHRVQRIDVHYNFIGEIDFFPEFSRYSKKTTA